MNLPEELRRELAARSEHPERQRIILALLLQPPVALRGPAGHHWRPPPLLTGSPAGGLARSRPED